VVTELILLGVVAGALLGLRYKVFVLVPATAIAIAVAGLDGIGSAAGLARISIMMIVTATALQLGYLLGTVIEAGTGRVGSAHGKHPVPTSTGMRATRHGRG
jgi:hypothetical protein